ncbi:MAG TPA: hypothetical protein VM146_03035 [Steroidobacteraceae bacterium]|nr:hypothetical protein [Steroidobacteraceae bacterium]
MRAQQLNVACACESVAATGQTGFYSGAPVFVSAAHLGEMKELIATIHRVVALPAFQAAVLAGAPPIARLPQRTHGVFAGFDFHVGADGPRLIEVNTNAGGALLNAVADWRHPDCCDENNSAVRVPASRASLESDFIAMFRNEWRLARGDRPLETVAIVDDQPAGQFLFPEFRLFEALLRAHGIDTLIVDAAALEYSRGELRFDGRAIDLVYNRLTDFYFTDPRHAALREAYLADAAVITPHPRAHALLADKRNLVRLTSPAYLRSLGVRASDVDVLQARIPQTRDVDGCAEAWWQDRKGWFFKPSTGFASRGAYRGDKITRRAFGEVMQGEYVAQRLAPPGERLRTVAGSNQMFKVDLRHYVYDGATLLMAARMYQGQTTNFRTAGGGFAPVIELCDG